MTDNIFSKDNIPSSNWMKFDNIGDICKGTVVKVETKEDNFGKMQTVYSLTNASIGKAEIIEGQVKNPNMEDVGELSVGTTKKFIIDKLANVKEGDIIAFAYLKDIPSKTKGYGPAKSIMPYAAGIDQAYLDSKNQLEANDVENVFE